MKMNSHFQGVSSVNTPERSAPVHPPTGAPAPKNPITRLRALPGGKVMPMIATALGTIIALPIPDKPLAMLKAMKLLQKPLMNVHKHHQTQPVSKTFLWP